MPAIKNEVAVLKREITKLKKCKSNADYRHKKEMVAAAKVHLEEIEKVRDSVGDLNSEINDLKRAKNKIVEEKSSLERTVSNQVQEIDNHEKNLRDIQRDMKTACELMYGDTFDPSEIGSPYIWQNGVEYEPRQKGDTVTSAPHYIDPNQRILRMIWRRTHWGLTPLVMRDNSRL